MSYPTFHEDIAIIKDAIRLARAGKSFPFTEALATAIERVIKESGRVVSVVLERSGVNGEGVAGRLEKALNEIDLP